MEKHIVIIEDDAAISDSMKMMLEMAGYRVSCLGELASIEGLADMHADCFILDEHLPIVSGHIICMMLRLNGLTSNVPVILTSADMGLAVVAGLSEPNASIQKPFDMTDFLHSVDAVLH
jgi:DNA-binding response OmpR family regulator